MNRKSRYQVKLTDDEVKQLRHIAVDLDTSPTELCREAVLRLIESEESTRRLNAPEIAA